LPGRHHRAGGLDLSDASAAAASAAPGHLPGWNDGPGRLDLPDSAATAATAASAARRRARLSR
jgi:hypothetical protein